MPHVTIPLGADGMIVEAVFGLQGSQTAALLQAQQPIPRPQHIRSLIDCGTDTTAIASKVFQQLGLGPVARGSSQTAAGAVPVNLYRVSLTIAGPAGRAGPVLAIPDLLVSELTVPLANLDALIGMDVLRQCLLVLDGPGQQFIFGF